MIIQRTFQGGVYYEEFSKGLFFILGYVASVLVPLLSTAGMSEGAGEMEEMLRITLAELIGVILMILIYKLIYTRIFTAAKEFRFKFPERRIIFGIILIYPLISFVKVVIPILGKNPEYMWVAGSGYTWDTITNFLVELPVVAIIGPVFEELCCRVYPITSFETRKGRIIAGIITMLLFSLLHISNWLTVVPDAILFTAVFIITGNIALPILMHVANNLSTIMVPMLSGIYMICLPKTTFGFAGFPMAIVIVIMVAFTCGVILLVKGIRSINTNSQ